MRPRLTNGYKATSQTISSSPPVFRQILVIMAKTGQKSPEPRLFLQYYWISSKTLLILASIDCFFFDFFFRSHSGGGDKIKIKSMIAVRVAHCQHIFDVTERHYVHRYLASTHLQQALCCVRRLQAGSLVCVLETTTCTLRTATTRYRGLAYHHLAAGRPLCLHVGLIIARSHLRNF